MTSRQSAFFFLNSDQMMQKILLRDGLSITFGFGHYRVLSNIFPLIKYRQRSKTMCTEVKYITPCNENT